MRVDIGNAVAQDIQDRISKGEKEYGERLQTHNGRNALQDAYEEALDLACYLKQALLEQASMDIEAHKDDMRIGMGMFHGWTYE